MSEPNVTAKKQRTLPFGGDDKKPAELESLEEKASRTVVEQYLMQRPDQLGQLLATLPREKMEAALSSVPRKDISNLRASLHGDANYKLKPSDRIAVLVNSEDGFENLEYSVVRFGSIVSVDIRRLIQLWYTAWLQDHPTPESRSKWPVITEVDGSATLTLNRELDELDDALDTVIDDDNDERARILEEDKKSDYPDGFDPEEEEDDDEKRERLQEKVINYFEGGAPRIRDVRTATQTNVWIETPKITVRIDTSDM